MRKVTKTYKKNVVLKIRKKYIKIDMMSVTWSLNICLLMLQIHTSKYYNRCITKKI